MLSTQNDLNNRHYYFHSYGNDFCNLLGTRLQNDPQTRLQLNSIATEGIKQFYDSDFFREIVVNKTEVKNEGLLNVTSGIGYVNSLVGTNLGFQQYSLHVSAKWNNGVDKWRGKNGVWYFEPQNSKIKFWGNQYTGTRNQIIKKAADLGGWGKVSLCFGIGLSAIQFAIHAQNNNAGGMIKTIADMSIAVIATFGGPVGLSIGALYLFLDLTGFFSTGGRTLSPQQIHPNTVFRDNTYVKPPLIVQPIKRVFIPNYPILKQGYPKR